MSYISTMRVDSCSIYNCVKGIAVMSSVLRTDWAMVRKASRHFTVVYGAVDRDSMACELTRVKMIKFFLS
jgi:hypothetical protein